MRNACLIITDKSGFLDVSTFSAFCAFAHSGYDFSEIRLLRFDVDVIKTAIQDCKKNADVIVVLADGFVFDLIKTVESAYGKTLLQNADSGAGVIDDGEKTLFLLPAQDENYVKDVCVPLLVHKIGYRIGSIVMRCVGVDGAKMQDLLAKVESMGVGRVKVCNESKYGEDVVRIFYDENTPRMLTDDILRFLADALKDNVYALDDTPLEKQLVDLLRLRRKKLAVAESFTGGGLAKKIVSVSGASDIYYEGLNTYAEGSKMERLGVTEYTLRSQGAVSEQTAYEMAAGLLSQGRCDVAIATTGLSGPKGDSFGHPVGTCCIAVGIDQNVYVYRYLLQGGRREISETAIRYALFLACKQLKNM